MRLATRVSTIASVCLATQWPEVMGDSWPIGMAKIERTEKDQNLNWNHLSHVPRFAI